MRRISSATATSSIPRPEWVASKSGYQSRRDAARHGHRVHARMLHRRGIHEPHVEGNSMRETRRAFILAAGSAAAAMSLPQVVRAADDTASSTKQSLAVDYGPAND